MRVLLAPDKFKDALSAHEAAAALARGVQAADHAAVVEFCPLADGGEGTGCLLAGALSAQRRTLSVSDPLNRPRDATWWIDESRQTAIIEMAEASGLWLLNHEQRDALRTTSYGTGQLLHAAIESGCKKIVLCVGGSATVDGGSGSLQALGWRFFDAHGEEITQSMCGGLLTHLARIEPPASKPEIEIEILCDVDNPLLGPRGAAPVFGPQKGADPSQVRELESGLHNWAEVLTCCTGRDVRDLPGAGAAGGITAGLAAALNATLKPGLDVVASYVDLFAKLAACDVVFTGEGRLEEQTSAGKVVAGVARLATTANRPTIAFVGAARLHDAADTTELAHTLGLQGIVVITPPNTPLDEALRTTGENLARAAEHFMRQSHTS